jgi:hypothetical protein
VFSRKALDIAMKVWNKTLRYGVFILSLCGLSGISPRACPETQPGVRNQSPKSVTFKSITDIASAGKIQLANGKTVDAQDWRTLIMAILGQQILEDGTKSDIICTGTLVGPGVFLTAAHCLDRGAGYPLLTGVDLWIAGGTVQAMCTVALAYREAVSKHIWNGYVPRVSQDFALCQFDIPANAASFFSSIDYEVVDVEEPLIPGARVLMSGFGCAKIVITATGDIQTTKSDKILRVGDESIRNAAIGGSGLQANFVTIASDPAIDPAICPGDSGGPLLSGATVDAQGVQRRVRGVNSIVGSERASSGFIALSRIAALGTPDFVTFQKQWRVDNPGKNICGLDTTAGVPPCAP